MTDLVPWAIAAVALAVPVALAVGSWQNRKQPKSCCAVADPRRDLRMRAAFEDEDAPSAPGVSA
ncbi:MAG TPA: hypothetical protein VEV13_03135 [Candidatus Limnocylindria bacterium]|nr:hypothetical protein [Candidatus Limnocylindria bacterium]